MPRRSGREGDDDVQTALIDAVGAVAATLTTLCWLPQAIKVLRERETRAISLPMTALLSLGVLLWLVYGLAIGDGPLIGANAVTLTFVLLIMGMKLRYG
jgi:MtN3 and saliva related transmembrane protein